MIQYFLNFLVSALYVAQSKNLLPCRSALLRSGLNDNGNRQFPPENLHVP